MKVARFYLLPVALTLLAASSHAQAPPPAMPPIKIILDTDFVIPPQDDGLALMLAASTNPDSGSGECFPSICAPPVPLRARS